MSVPAIASFNRLTSFSEEIAALEALRKARRSKIKKYPSLTVLVSTCREEDLTSLLHQLLNQSLPEFDMQLGLHNISLNPAHKKLLASLAKRGVKTSHHSYDGNHNLGEILTDLAKKASSQYIAKMDDDDYYGPEHLRDLLDVAIDTQADVVGKAMNYVYLEPLQISVRRFSQNGTQAVELWSDWVCGGTILARREAAEAAGYFGDVHTAVDRYLLSGVTKNGGKIYRTFGAGYIYRRTFTFHTYVTNYSKYLNGANEQVVGIWNHPIFGATR